MAQLFPILSNKNIGSVIKSNVRTDSINDANYKNTTASQRLPNGGDLVSIHNAMFQASFTPDANYQPLTATKLPKGASIIPFIVGVRVAPSQNIFRMRTFDRSYSVAGASDYINTESEASVERRFVPEDELIGTPESSSAPVKPDTGPKKKKDDPVAAKAAREAAAREAAATAKRNYEALLADIARTQQDANRTAVGKAYQKLQRQIITDINYASMSLGNVPPIQLLINPQSFTVSSSRIVTDGNWARNGPSHVVEHWGDAQDTITAQGRVAGFYANFKDAARQKQSGLSRSNRAFTQSYENLMSLFLLYRNNGAIKTVDYADVRGQATTKQENIALMAPMYIFYDNTLYFGSFNSFELTEEAEAPFTLSYTFEFVARQTILLDKPVQPSR